MLLIGLICVLEIFFEMSKDLNNQKNDELRLVVRYSFDYLCYKKYFFSDFWIFFFEYLYHL